MRNFPTRERQAGSDALEKQPRQQGRLSWRDPAHTTPLAYGLAGFSFMVRGKGMERGKITMYSRNSGYGFIKPYQGGADVFFHYRAMRAVGRRLQVSDEVDFEVAQGPKGYYAVRAELVNGQGNDHA